MKRWVVGFIFFIIIWIVGSIALDLVLPVVELDIRYSGAIAFVVGLIVMIWYGMDLNESKQVEE